MTEDKKYLINLYVEQIKYLRQENVSIQDKFLNGNAIPLTALGVMIFYIESQKLYFIYLFLPFLYLAVPYNVVKYTIRMMGINGYIKYLESKVNFLMKDDVFLWNSHLIDSGFFGGFALVSTLAQIPIHVVAFIFLVCKFLETQKSTIYFQEYHSLLNMMLVMEAFFIGFMLLDAALVQQIVLEKLESHSDKVDLKKIIIKLLKKSKPSGVKKHK